MSKKVPLPRKPGLHFETVPVTDVAKKKITPDDGAVGRRKKTDDLIAEPGPRPRVRAGRPHGVQFYNDPDALCRIVGGFVGGGLEQGAPALLIATPDHVIRIDECLRARGIDVDGLRRQGSLVTLDAQETLQRFMVDGMPNPGTFRRVINSTLTHVRRGREHHTIRAYGEMVDLLWKAGLEAAAIRLETLWNQLDTDRDFKLLCGYSMGNFFKGAAIEAIHDQRSRLTAGNGETTGAPDRQAESAPPP